MTERFPSVAAAGERAAPFSPGQQSAWRFAVALTVLRAVLAPALIYVAWLGAPGWTLATIVAVAFLSDVFDGVVARRGNVATPGLRRADSIVDIGFYVAVAWTMWSWYRPLLVPVRFGVLALVAGEIVSNGLALVKFGRDASYHPWSARVWGLSLFVSVVVLFAFGTGVFLPAPIVLGLIAQLEAIAITLVLPAWQTDVRSIGAALRISKLSRAQGAAT